VGAQSGRGRLVALPVPWMVSPSVPELHVTIVENGDAIVEVVRHFVLVGHDMWLELLALDFERQWSTRRAKAIDLS